MPSPLDLLRQLANPARRQQFDVPPGTPIDPDVAEGIAQRASDQRRWENPNLEAFGDALVNIPQAVQDVVGGPFGLHSGSQTGKGIELGSMALGAGSMAKGAIGALKGLRGVSAGARLGGAEEALEQSFKGAMNARDAEFAGRGRQLGGLDPNFTPVGAEDAYNAARPGSPAMPSAEDLLYSIAAAKHKIKAPPSSFGGR